jgi:hypothetical protein
MLGNFQCRLLKKDLRGEAREVRRAEAYVLVRWSQPGKRNEAYEAFSAALPG